MSRSNTLFPSLMSSQAQTIGQSLNLGKEYTPETAAKMQALERRQQMVNALIAQGMQPKEVRQAGRFVVAPSMIEQLSGPISVALGALGSGYLEDERGEIQKAETARVAQAMQDFATETAPRQPYSPPMVPGSPAVDEIPESYTTKGAVADAIVGPPPPNVPRGHKPIGSPVPETIYTPGVPGKPAVLPRPATVEEYLTTSGFDPEIVKGVKEGRIDPASDQALKAAVDRVMRPSDPGGPVSDAQFMAAVAKLVASGVPNAWPLAQLTMQQREAEEARKEAAASRPLTQIPLGDKMLLMRGSEQVATLPIAPPPGVEFHIAGNTLFGVNKRGDVVSRTPFAPTQKDTADIMNQKIIQLPDGTWGFGPAVDAQVKIEQAKIGPRHADKFLDVLAKRHEQLVKAPPLLANMEMAKKLIPAAGSFVGAVGDRKLAIAKFFNNNFGLQIDIEGVKSAEELAARLEAPVIHMLKQVDAQPTEKQQDALRAALGALTTDPNALIDVINVQQDILRSNVDAYNVNAQSALDRGTLFDFDPRIKLPEPSKPPRPPRPVKPLSEEEKKKRAESFLPKR